MMLFVIFVCMVTGCTCLELQRAEDGEKNLKSNNNAMEAALLAANGTINEDQYASDQPAVTSSSEIEASDKPRSAVTTTTMTSDVKRSGQSVYVGRRVIENRSVFKHSHPNISALRYSMKGRRRFPGTSAAIRDVDKDFAIHRKGPSREKRRVRWVPGKPLSPEEQKHNSECFDDGFVKGLFNDEHFPDIKQLALESLKKDVALVGNLAKSGTVSTDVLNEYKAAKTAERKYMHQGLNSYSAFEEREFPGERKRNIFCYGELNSVPQRCSDYELRAKYGAFLDKPSPARDRYKAMKAKEDATYPSYFDSQGGQDIYEGQTENEFEGLPPVDNNAEPDFECPKKKRESGSVAPKMRAQIFVILICVVIVILISGLQGLEIDEDDNNAGEDKRIVLLLERSGSQELRFDSI